MTTEIEIFKNPEFGEVRVVMDENNEPWFLGTDVAGVLGYTDLTHCVQDHVDEEDRKPLKYKDSVKITQSLWTNPNDFKDKWVINESGVYALIFGSTFPKVLEIEYM